LTKRKLQVKNKINTKGAKKRQYVAWGVPVPDTEGWA
jgi:hypothetical protein